MGENEIGRNGKRAGQILFGMGKGRSWKGRKKNRRNGKNLGEMGMGKMGLGKLGINPIDMSILYYKVTTFNLSQTTILNWSKLKEFADDNFKFDENSRNFSKRVENTAGKGEIACY